MKEKFNPSNTWEARSPSDFLNDGVVCLKAALLQTERDFKSLINSIPTDEKEEAAKLFSGEAVPAVNIMTYVPIEGAAWREVVFSGPYTEALQDLQLQAIPVGAADLETYPKQNIPVSPLSHWQLKRAYCQHFAKICIEAASEDMNAGRFARAMSSMCQALKLIGAAGVPSYDGVEKAAISDSGRKNANLGHAGRNKAKDFVNAEWEKHKEDYEQNKSAFARDYSRRVFNEYGIKVTDRNLRERWIK